MTSNTKSGKLMFVGMITHVLHKLGIREIFSTPSGEYQIRGKTM
jgi:hypothetical protein